MRPLFAAHHPVAVLGGSAPADRRLSGRTIDTLRQSIGYSRVIDLTNLALEEMPARVAALPRDAVILLDSTVADRHGRPITSQSVLSAIKPVLRVPTLVSNDALLGQGVLGGSLYRIEDLGTQAARTTVRVLDGARARRPPGAATGCERLHRRQGTRPTRAAGESRAPGHDAALARPRHLGGVPWLDSRRADAGAAAECADRRTARRASTPPGVAAAACPSASACRHSLPTSRPASPTSPGIGWTRRSSAASSGSDGHSTPRTAPSGCCAGPTAARAGCSAGRRSSTARARAPCSRNRCSRGHVRDSTRARRCRSATSPIGRFVPATVPAHVQRLVPAAPPAGGRRSDRRARAQPRVLAGLVRPRPRRPAHDRRDHRHRVGAQADRCVDAPATRNPGPRQSCRQPGRTGRIDRARVEPAARRHPEQRGSRAAVAGPARAAVARTARDRRRRDRRRRARRRHHPQHAVDAAQGRDRRGADRRQRRGDGDHAPAGPRRTAARWLPRGRTR